MDNLKLENVIYERMKPYWLSSKWDTTGDKREAAEKSPEEDKTTLKGSHVGACDLPQGRPVRAAMTGSRAGM